MSVVNHKRLRSAPIASANSQQILEGELRGALEVVTETLHGVANSGLFDVCVFSTSDAQRTAQLLSQVLCRGDPQWIDQTWALSCRPVSYPSYRYR